MQLHMPVLSKAIQILLFAILAVIALYFAKELLVPICFAGLLAMLLLSLCNKMEARRIPRGIAAFLCILLIVVVVAGLVLLLQWQLSNMAKDLNGMEQRITEQVTKAKQFISQNLGISEQQQKEMAKKQSPGGSIIGSVMGVLVDTVLVMVYIFLFLYFRAHIKKFILKLVPNSQKDKTLTIIHECTKVAQHYLNGLAMMIATLWVLYSIGFSLIGVPSPIFFAILCGLLEIIPFIGNLTGTALTILFTIAEDGGTNKVVGIVLVYGLIQFVQSYMLEPLIVGKKVNINPLFTIMALVAGELVWGVPGIILAIPLLAIVKIICDHIAPLQPYGFLIGSPEKKKKKKS